MVRKLSIDEWRKTQENPEFEDLKKERSGTFEKPARRPRRGLGQGVVSGFILGVIVAAALGFYFYGDFSRWWLEGGLAGVAVVILWNVINRLR